LSRFKKAEWAEKCMKVKGTLDVGRVKFLSHKFFFSISHAKSVNLPLKKSVTLSEKKK
jgi:hypothetical protein